MREKKNAINDVCWVTAGKVTPYANVMKLGVVDLVGYVIALTAIDPHRLTGAFKQSVPQMSNGNLWHPVIGGRAGLSPLFIICSLSEQLLLDSKAFNENIFQIRINQLLVF